LTAFVGLSAAVLAIADGSEAATSAHQFVRPAFAQSGADRLALLSIDRAAPVADFAALAVDGEQCFRALDAERVSYRRIAAAEGSTGCGHGEALQLRGAGIDYRSQEPLVMTCPLAARLYLWQELVVIPAAEAHFGQGVSAIDAYGAFSCRRVKGSSRLSEHAFGRAIDIRGFVLDDGRTISVERDYAGAGPEGEFLREAFSRSCEVFDVALGPGYDAAHADHFHFDVGGRQVCR
jgi:hypothetical protein